VLRSVTRKLSLVSLCVFVRPSNFAPMVDVARDARWGRVMEGAGRPLSRKPIQCACTGFQETI
jgi:hypothetical protein